MSKDTLSANTLFHFTKSLDNLESILRNDFYPRYCLENLDVIFPEFPEMRELGIPMISFCDIPLSLIKNHIKYYGSYAIGLTKEWGMKNKICPVLYTYKQSELSAHLKRILVKIIRYMPESSKTLSETITHDWLKVYKFFKPYAGNLWREGNYLKEEICFYDEREWRFCPNIPISAKPEKDQPQSFMGKNSFVKLNIIENENKKLEKYKLSFEPKDIKYIVDKEDEISEMFDKINEIKKKYSIDDRKILTPRIVSMEHILEDF